MKLDGKFSYLKKNQRTLSFNVDIEKLPLHKTVFAGSSSKKEIHFSKNVVFCRFLDLHLYNHQLHSVAHTKN